MVIATSTTTLVIAQLLGYAVAVVAFQGPVRRPRRRRERHRS